MQERREHVLGQHLRLSVPCSEILRRNQGFTGFDRQLVESHRAITFQSRKVTMPTGGSSALEIAYDLTWMPRSSPFAAAVFLAGAVAWAQPPAPSPLPAPDPSRGERSD